MSKVSNEIADKLRPLVGEQTKCKMCGDGTLMVFTEIEGRYAWVCQKKPGEHVLKAAGW